MRGRGAAWQRPLTTYVNGCYRARMRKSVAVKHFGGIPKMSRILGVTRQAIYKWPEEVPDLYQYKLHYLSGYRLRVTGSPTRQAAQA